jgi:hypothetical protein
MPIAGTSLSLWLLCACAGVTPSVPSEPPDVQAVAVGDPVPPPARVEPVTLDLPGWSLTEGPAHDPNERVITFREGPAVVELVRWWEVPEVDGGPMQVAERRPVQIDGVDTELLRTSLFEGKSVEADVLFLRAGGWSVRVSCLGCAPEQLDAVVQGLSVRREASEPSDPAIDCSGPGPLVPRCPASTSDECAEMWAVVEAWRAACEAPSSPEPEVPGSTPSSQ